MEEVESVVRSRVDRYEGPVEPKIVEDDLANEFDANGLDVVCALCR